MTDEKRATPMNRTTKTRRTAKPGTLAALKTPRKRRCGDIGKGFTRGRSSHLHMSKARTPAATVAAMTTTTLTVREPSEESRTATVASNAVSANVTAAIVVAEFLENTGGEVVREVVRQLEDKVKAVHRGDLTDGEALLMTQAIALNAIFTGLVLLGGRTWRTVSTRLSDSCDWD